MAVTVQIMAKKILFITLGLIVLGAVLLPFYVVRQLNHSASGSNQPVSFTVKDGDSTSQIGDNLVRQKLINSKLAYLAYVYARNKKILAGEYELSADLTEKSLIDAISVGHIKTTRVTIPEGWRTEQIASRLAEKKVVKYDDFIQAAKSSEGYLFPDTYEFKSDVTAAEIVQTMTANFSKRTAGLNITLDTLKLASIIEREAKFDADRPKIARVYLNRLDHNMKLEADPTVQYAKDSLVYSRSSIVDREKFEFWGKITSSDYLNVQSLYNTYIYLGLPPAPICNPGLKSILGALNPDTNDYFYFLQTPDGKTYYAQTAAEHEANKKKYLQ